MADEPTGPATAPTEVAGAAGAASADSPGATPGQDAAAALPANEGFEPEIIVFACHYCAYAAADLAGSMRLQYPTNIRMIKLPCTGKLEVIHLLRALEAGADGVYAAGCLEGECHYLKGNLWAKKRVGYVKKLLEEIGVDPGRVEMYNMSSAMGPQFAETARSFTARIRGLGPNPVRPREGFTAAEVVRRQMADVALPDDTGADATPGS
jgi:coenzyme F420-reducing hydrogenase delta subunit